MDYKEIKGDLIKLALMGEFDVIAHGCNCHCTMGAGIAPQMAQTFGCDKYSLESYSYKGNHNKLGCISIGSFYTKKKEPVIAYYTDKKNDKLLKAGYKRHRAVNCYTQYNYGMNHEDGVTRPLDYEALTLCMRKIAYRFKGQHIGLPQIGCGLAGGDWAKVSEIITRELKECKVTVVIFDKNV